MHGCTSESHVGPVGGGLHTGNDALGCLFPPWRRRFGVASLSETLKCLPYAATTVVLHGLIKWSGMPATLATWENLESLRRRFPDASPWGQVNSQEEGNVSNHATSSCPVPPSSEASPRPHRNRKPSVKLVAKMGEVNLYK
jgi:hypothetical protein